MLKSLIIILNSLLLLISLYTPLVADQKIIAIPITQEPIIDGKAEVSPWSKARTHVTHDKIGDLDITIKALYSKDRIFFLVQYPDKNASSSHKPWVWNPNTSVYEMGPQREDSFVFKWSMVGNKVDLRVHSDDNYTADVWFWKACRTNPAGYADDKIQRLSFDPAPKTNSVTSRSGKTAYLSRRGDAGNSAYNPSVYIDFRGDKVEQFQPQPPTESRADIKAKGIWTDGQWTIEFARRLSTGHDDDIRLDPAMTYLFGISRYEIAGRQPDPTQTQPLHGCGDTSERLILEFAK